MSKSLFLFGSAAVAAQAQSIVDAVVATKTLSTLEAVLTMPAYADVLATLDGPGPFTVFAPNDAAFTAAGLDTTQTGLITQTLLNHAVPEIAAGAADIVGTMFLPTAANVFPFVNMGGDGQKLAVTNADGTVTVNFGQGTATVTVANVNCTNGMVHIIDKVMLLPKDVVGTATDNGLSTLLDAVTEVDLATTVNDTPSLTIFAPTNDAFTAADWMALDNVTLASVLQYHVVSGVAYSDTLSNGQKIATLGGEELTVTIAADGTVMINDANVVIANVQTANGVVHVIDSVMLPPASAPTVASGSSVAAPTAAALVATMALFAVY